MYGLSQEEFGKRIGIESRGHISSLENGVKNITDRIINDVCREFNINEEWIRTGKGEMTYTKERNQVISEFAADLIKEPESFKTRLFESMAKLDEKDWIEIERIFDKLKKG